MIPATPGTEEPSSDLTPHEFAENKMMFYKIINKYQWPKFEKTLEWWSSRYVKETYLASAKLPKHF
jgi:hypothetical protein